MTLDTDTRGLGTTQVGRIDRVEVADDDVGHQAGGENGHESGVGGDDHPPGHVGGADLGGRSPGDDEHLGPGSGGHRTARAHVRTSMSQVATSAASAGGSASGPAASISIAPRRISGSSRSAPTV